MLHFFGVAMALVFFGACKPMLFENIYCKQGIDIGFLQPFAGPTFVLMMFGAGLMCVQLQEHKRLRLPLSFLAYVLLGLVGGMLDVSLPWMASLQLMTVVILGLSLCRMKDMTFASAQAVLGICALIHGYAQGGYLDAFANPIWFSLGFLLCTAFIFYACVLAVLLLKRVKSPWLATRTCGHLIVSAGVLMWVL